MIVMEGRVKEEGKESRTLQCSGTDIVSNFDTFTIDRPTNSRLKINSTVPCLRHLSFVSLLRIEL